MNTAIAHKPIATFTKWEAALARLHDATDVYDRYKRDVLEPTDAAERAFEKRHGLSTEAPDYFSRRRALQETHGYQKPASLEEAGDHLCDQMCQAQSALMAVRAPDHAALLVKLEELLSITSGSTDSWSEDYAGQTIEDMRRLLK